MDIKYSLESSRRNVEAGIAELENEQITLPENVNVHFFFVAHEKAEDLGDEEVFRDQVRDSDIVILEIAAWDESFTKGFNKVSRGDYKEITKLKQYYESTGDTFIPAVAKAIYNTRKPIIFVDVPKSDPRQKHVHNLMQVEGKGQGDFRVYFPANTNSFEDSVRISLADQDYFAAADYYRERRMLTTIGPTIQQVLNSNSKLSQKEQIRVLFEIGASHTSLFHNLRGIFGAERITRTFGNGLPVFARGNIIIRSRLLGVELNDETRRNIATRSFFMTAIDQVAGDTSAYDGLSRYQIERLCSIVSMNFSIEEIVSYYHLKTVSQKVEVDDAHDRIHKLLVKYRDTM